MTVFGNLGFVGLPLVQAVYGAGAVLYVVDFILVYNILMFSYGTFVLRPEDGEKNGGLLKNLMNPGFIASIVTIIFFFFDIRLPAYFQSVTLYGGEIVVALAIFTIGANLADLKMKEVVNDPHAYHHFGDGASRCLGAASFSGGAGIPDHGNSGGQRRKLRHGSF